MLILNWTADHECRRQVSGDGLNATIHLKKDGRFYFPESAEKVIRKQFADALQCKYCTIESVQEKSHREIEE